MKYLICLFAGILSAFGFVPTSLIFLCFISYPVLFYFLNKISSKKQLFSVGFSFGFGQGAVSMAWIINALMIDNGAFIWATPLVPLCFGLFFGIFFALSTLTTILAHTSVRKLFLFAGSMSFLEWVRSWIFTGFPWNLVGSVWVEFLPVLQIVSLVGIYGLTLISILWFMAPYFIYIKHYKMSALLITSFVIIASFGAFRMYIIPNDMVWGVKLRIVQANIPQSLKWDSEKAEENFMLHIRLSKSKPEDKITHVLWPEAASPYLLDVDDNARALTMSALQQNATLITGSLRLANAKEKQLANSILIIDDMGKILSFADKSHLVPFGEYMPLRGWFGLEKLVPIANDLKQADSVKTLPVPNASPVGMLNCYEVIFPGKVVNKKFRPSWLFNATNDTWYGISAGPYQHLAAAQTRATEEGLPLVRAASGGISAVILPTGKILKYLPLNTQGVLDSELPKPLPQTLYGRFGNKIPLSFALLCIFVCIQKRKKKNSIIG